MKTYVYFTADESGRRILNKKNLCLWFRIDICLHDSRRAGSKTQKYDNNSLVFSFGRVCILVLFALDWFSKEYFLTQRNQFVVGIEKSNEIDIFMDIKSENNGVYIIITTSNFCHRSHYLLTSMPYRLS